MPPSLPTPNGPAHPVAAAGSSRRFVAALMAAGLAGAGTLTTAAMLLQTGHRGPPILTTALSAGLLLLPYFWFGLIDTTKLVRAATVPRGRILALTSALLVPYLVYAFGSNSFRQAALAKLALFLFAPVALLAGRSTPLTRLTWADALALLLVWWPLEFRWLLDVWPWPEGQAAYALASLLAVDLALLVFLGLRRLDGVGYRLYPAGGDGRAALFNFTAFSALAIPIGLVTGFLRFNPHADFIDFAGSFVAIFVTIALPEELLFRGLIQNLLHKTWGRPGRALVATAVLFGVAHLNNGPAPDWRYVLLATLAGIFYGRAYFQSGGLLAPALVHAGVDAVWRGLFR